MQTNSLVKETTSVNGRRLTVKWISLGSIFRQVVLSPLNTNYSHYMWPLGMLVCVLGCVLFLVEKYLEKIPKIWITIFALLCITISIIYFIMTDIVEESIQVIDTFGIQLSSKTRFNKENKMFFDFNSIKDVIINEAVTMHRVIFYLALVIKDKDFAQGKKEKTRLITVFRHTMPTLEIIKDVYNEIQPFLLSNNNDTQD